MGRRGKKNFQLRKDVKPRNPWNVSKQRKKAGLFIKFVLAVEEELPGASGNEKKEWVKRQLDNLINLPPIAEQISDFIINIGVEVAYAGVQAMKANDDLKVLSIEEYEKLVKDSATLVKRNAEYRTLYLAWRALSEEEK